MKQRTAYASRALAFKDASYACAVQRFPRNTWWRAVWRLLTAQRTYPDHY